MQPLHHGPNVEAGQQHHADLQITNMSYTEGHLN